MKLSALFTLVLALAFLARVPAAAEETGKLQTNCPVEGGKINKELFTDYAGWRVYFCCPDCIDSFRKDPEGYLGKMKAEGILPARAPKPQTLCPVLGGEVNRDTYGDYKGKRVYFCCEQCKIKFEAAPAVYLKKLHEEGIELEKIPESQGEGS